MPFTPGNNFSNNISCESASEAERLFQAFSANGKITMPIAETFWAERFGMLTDQFGVNWMFNYEKPRDQYMGHCAKDNVAEPVTA
jgi:PhnB protein